jgi:hypothetical protein
MTVEETRNDGIRLVALLMTGKQPCKYSDELWQIAIKMLKNTTPHPGAGET